MSSSTAKAQKDITRAIFDFVCGLLFLCTFSVGLAGQENPALPQKDKTSTQPSMRVSFVNPAAPGEAFWDRVTRLMQEEAQARHIQLAVHYAQGNRLKVLELVRQIIAQEPKPDYLIFVFQAQLGEHLLGLTEAAGLPSFSINTNIPEQEVAAIGYPRQKYRYWLGHMFPDEQSAGFTLAQSLVEQARKQSGSALNRPLTMIAIGGGHDSAASVERLEGLTIFLNAQPNVTLAQTVKASWQKDKSRDMAEVLLRRYPETSIIWTASDLMALGALQAAEIQGKVSGKTVFAGGFDGTIEGLVAIYEGRMQATMSGHYLEGARALTLLHAHFNGQDFADTVGTRIRTKLTLIDSGNVSSFLSEHVPSASTK